MDSIYFETNFIGRKTILDLLKKRVLGLKEGYRQNIALVGSRFVGKTSILLRFIADWDDEEIIKIYVNLDDGDIRDFYTKLVGNILYNYAKIKNLPLHNDVKLLIESVRSSLPNTIQEVERIQSELAHGRYSHVYRQLIDLPEKFSIESGKFCLICLDEFQHLEDLGVPHVFQDLGKKIMTQSRNVYVVTSSYPARAKQILSEKLSLLFGNFEVVHVEPFDLRTSQDFIAGRLQNIKMSMALRSFLIDFTGGQPLYLNLLLKELVELCSIHNQRDIFRPILSKAIEQTIFNPWGAIGRHFELTVDNLCLEKGNRVIGRALVAIAHHKFKLAELVKHLEEKQRPLSQKVNRLIEMGIVEKNGTILYIKDKLFRYWIKYVYQQRLTAVESMPEKLKKQFKNEVNRSIDNFKLVSQKEFPARITELLGCFDNEALDINGRKYRLPNFNRVEPLPSWTRASGSFDVIRASSDDGDWLIVFKRDVFCENDIHAFLSETQKLEEKPMKCVLISLAEPEQNARLKALQERFWIWNEVELNMLLNFYDKPAIV